MFVFFFLRRDKYEITFSLSISLKNLPVNTLLNWSLITKKKKKNNETKTVNNHK